MVRWRRYSSGAAETLSRPQRRGTRSRYAASSAPGAGVLGKGRFFFLVLATLAAANSQLAFSLPPWPEDKSPWRYLLRCRSSSLQDLSSSGTLLY